MPSSLPRAGLWPLAGVIVLFGAAWPVTKLAVQHGAGPAWFALGRAGFSGLITFAAVSASGRLRVPARADLVPLLAVGFLQLAGFFALSHLAVALVPAGRTAVLSNATGVWIVPLSLLVGERISSRQWLAAALGLLGVLVIVGPWGTDWSRPGSALGNALLLGAALSWALAMVAIRRPPARLYMHAQLPRAFCARPAGRWDGTAWAALLGVGLIAGPGGTWCVLQATRRLPMVVASTGFLGAPAMGLLLASAWLGETLTPELVIGSTLILGGVAFAALPLPGRRPA